MNTADFERIVSEQIELSTSVLCNKAIEYATQDRLHNFKVAAGIQDCTPIQALAGMMAKHTVSVYDMCNIGDNYPLELWSEKITDSINYLILLRALVEEKE